MNGMCYNITSISDSAGGCWCHGKTISEWHDGFKHSL